jgi:hypothetical protein
MVIAASVRLQPQVVISKQCMLEAKWFRSMEDTVIYSILLIISAKMQLHCKPEWVLDNRHILNISMEVGDKNLAMRNYKP